MEENSEDETFALKVSIAKLKAIQDFPETEDLQLMMKLTHKYLIQNTKVHLRSAELMLAHNAKLKNMIKKSSAKTGR